LGVCHPGAGEIGSPETERRGKVVYRNGGGMAHFEAMVRLFDIVEPDPLDARRAVEERLRAAGFTRWHIVNVGLQGANATRATRSLRRPMRTDMSYAGGGLLVAAVVAWTLWFLWLLAG